MTTNDKTWFEKQVNRELFRQTVCRLALADVGYDETPVNRTKYGKWYGMDGSPWCAMALSNWYHSAAQVLHVPNPLTVLGAKGFAHVTSTWARIVDKHPQWMLAQNDTPMPGDIFFWDHDSRAGGPGHTELYVRHISRKNLVITGLWVGGNTNSGFSRTGGSVCSHLHPVKVGKVGAHGYLLGVARPTREFWTAKP